jgi:hypothetical protein
MPDIDYTKTKSYALIDLISKVISSTALIALGVAGWQLQSHTQAESETRARLERQEKEYLPALEALSLLQVSALDTVDLIGNESVANLDSDRITRVARLINYVVDSLYFPASGQLRINLTPVDQYDATPPGHTQASVEMRSAGHLMAEFLSSIREIQDVCAGKDLSDAPKLAVLRPNALYFSRNPKLLGERIALPGDRYVTLDTSGEAWSQWYPAQGLSVDSLCALKIGLLPREVSTGAGSAIQTILNRSPDLADKFVGLRVQALDAYKDLLVSTEQTPGLATKRQN